MLTLYHFCGYYYFDMYRNDETTLELATMFKALGDPTRLRIFVFLQAQCCPVAIEGETGDVRPVTGPTVGEVCCHVTGEPGVTSTVSFHLKELRQAGLITMERQGRHMLCGLHQEAAAKLAAFLGEAVQAAPRGDCCE